jgi:hypothetical protein
MSMLVKINEDQKTIMQFYKDMKDDQQKLLSKVARIEDHLDITQYLPTTVLPVHDDGSNFINTIPCITEAPTATSLDIDPVPTPPHSSGTAQDQRATVTPVPAPPRGNEISGSSIITSQLTPVESALQRYSSWLIDSKFSALAIKLAREVFFGDNVLRQCTPRGLGDFPALPHDVLNKLKMTLLDAFPVYWSKPDAFELIWATAMEAIGQQCKRLRKKNPL